MQAGKMEIESNFSCCNMSGSPERAPGIKEDVANFISAKTINLELLKDNCNKADPKNSALLEKEYSSSQVFVFF